MERIFLRYVHNFRGLAILFIVAGHIINDLTWTDTSNLRVIHKVIFLNGTVYFIFIAGFLFQFLSEKYEYKDYLTKKLKYVLLPYLLLSLPILVLRITGVIPAPEWFSKAFSGLHSSAQFIVYLLTGAHLRPFWFIPTIVIFYLVSPLLLKIDRNPKMYWSIPFLLTISIFVPRPEANNNAAQSFVHFLSIYTLGMFCSHYQERLLMTVGRFMVPIVLAIVGLVALETTIDPSPVSLNVIQKFLLCLTFMYFLWKYDEYIPARIHDLMSLLANLSFGIFFIHDYIILSYFKLVRKFWGENTIFAHANLLTFLLIFSLTVGLCIALILGLKKLLSFRKSWSKNSRLIVGC